MEFLSFLKVKERQSIEAKFPWNPLHDIVIEMEFPTYIKALMVATLYYNRNMLEVEHTWQRFFKQYQCIEILCEAQYSVRWNSSKI